ncbi:MAG TPA: efflux RND transporter periplasmic adaptor subunit, partial [Rhodanobacter sp.]
MSPTSGIEVRGRRRLVWLAAAAVLAAALLAILAVRLWPSSAPQTASEVAQKPAADGSIELSDSQIRSQSIASAAVAAATQLPLPGLPAQAAAPLEASAQVAVPYAGVVTRILVDEGGTVRKGQPLARLQSLDLLTAQADLARARSEAAAASQQARRDAALLAEGIIA